MRRASSATFLILAAGGIFAAAVFGQPQSGQRRGGGFGGGFNLDSEWALGCFQLETEDKLLPQLRAAFREAYDLRAEVFEAMRAGEIEREGIGEEIALIQEELAESLGKPLEWAVGFFFGNTELSMELWTTIAGMYGFDDS